MAMIFSEEIRSFAQENVPVPSFKVNSLCKMSVFMNRKHKHTRRGWGEGAVIGKIENEFHSGKFALSRAEMLVNNGLCVGQPPRYFLPVRL